MKTVLILDDDKDLRALLKSALGSRGLDVVEAGSGREANEVLRETPVDLVIVDGLLPDGSGVTFIERLRAAKSSIRIVFMSAFFRDMKTFSHLTAELDVSLVVYKPIDLMSFVAKVVELVEPRRAETEGSPGDASPFVAELAELRRQFEATLPEKLAALDAAIEAARLDPDCVGDARTLAHRLRGSAGSYGHASVGVAVGQVEDMLAEALPRAPALGSFSWEDVKRALGAARVAAACPPEQSGRWTLLPSAPTKVLLVVDDDTDFLQMVKSTARLMVEVVTAQSSGEALLRAGSSHLIGAILDVHMNEEDTFALARKIRETPGNAEVPIAFASVDRRIETRVAAIEAGGTKFFEKPISEENINGIVQQLVRQSEAHQGRVLIVEDDRDVAAQYARYLRLAGLSVEHLPSADALVETLEASRPDVVLLDVNLPRVSGIDVCRALRMSERWELLPILIVTAQTDADTRLRAFRAGASDVIAKPVLPEELLARVGMQEERVRLLRERSDKDVLSGLLLRRAFLEAFERAMAGCTREHKPLSLVLIDLDHFKKINDTYGHLAGDQVIARLGDLLRRRFRVEDLRGRWGGEEFLLVFPGQGTAFAAQAARRVLAEFREFRFVSDDEISFGATFTAGVAGYPGDGTAISALIRRADERLYAGKMGGRNRISDPPPSA